MYVYHNYGNGDLKLEKEMTFKRDRANYGRAMASVGDINLDGFDGKGVLAEL